MRLKQMALVLAGMLAAAFGAKADPTVTINSVRQNYPWNNQVEINYTIGGTIAADSDWYANFTATYGSTTVDLTGTELGVGDDAVTLGTRTAVWTAPAGISTDSATIAITLTEGGDDYMIVDLTTGEVTYEKLKTQSASNAKYNTAEYKTTKMVFRKVTAPSGSIALATGSHTFSHDYYIGVFQVTEAQYKQLITSYGNSSTKALGGISWETMRGSQTDFNTIPGIGHATSSTTSFIALLNKKVKAAYAKFDLPTEAAWEYASYGGEDVSRTYFFTTATSGVDSQLANYAWYTSNSGNARHEVGGKLPNGYGLYDVYGNVWEFCRDRYNGTVQANAFVAASSGSHKDRCFRGGCFDNPSSYSSSVIRNHYAYYSTYDGFGFRLAWGCQ